MNYNIEDNFKSVQVISTIIQGYIIEYVSYQAVDSTGKEIYDDQYDKPSDDTSDRPSDDKTDKHSSDTPPKPEENDKTTLYVVIDISCFFAIVVIALIIVIVIYNSRKKDLLKQVNKISFVNSDADGKDDSNLLMDNNKNELD